MTLRALRPAAAFVFAFTCFFPNPALPIGSSTGLQAGQILVLAALPVLLLVSSVPRRHSQILLVLTVPVVLAGALAVISGRAFSDQAAVNTIVATALVLIVLLPGGHIARARTLGPVLAGAASAILVHGAVGVYQMYSFTNDVFPLPGLYQNPSFLSVISTDPNPWAVYVKRPFGLFPEPSAMAASTGPWLVLFLGLLLRPDLGRRLGVRNWLLVAAMVAGTALIIVARSGFTIFLLAGFLLVASPAIGRAGRRIHRLTGLVTIASLASAVVLVTAFALTYLSGRVESEVEGGESWPLRMASILAGIGYLATSGADLWFGAGPGQSSPALESIGAVGSSLGGETGAAANWSVIGSYVQETGLIGAAAILLTLLVATRAVAASNARLIGFSCLFVWLAAVVLTTSYLSLLPVWLMFAVLVGWDRVAARPEEVPRVRLLRVRKAALA